jgi:hypothetical protein
MTLSGLVHAALNFCTREGYNMDFRRRRSERREGEDGAPSYAPLFFGHLFARPPCFCKGWKNFIYAYHRIGAAETTILNFLDQLEGRPERKKEYDKLGELLVLQHEIGKYFSRNFCEKRAGRCQDVLKQILRDAVKLRRELDAVTVLISIV